ncbi:Hsp20/alpha crystallin family protein [Arhodomonas sp. AD133]|uniref:Hsp20/alpha crystallin family protein n=1 Tax=Arhodomonas sp. AD133 TaxID=3415009 RepID=UPI003EB7F8A1
MSDVKRSQGQEVADREAARGSVAEDRSERPLLPPVDIVEENEAIRIYADMPGVAPEGVSIELDNNVLTVKGDIRVDMPEGIAATYAEVRGSQYYRRFTLGREIDAEGIKAEVKDGVLSLALPKKEAHRRRRIEVQTA